MFGKQISLNSFFSYGEILHHWNLPRGRDIVFFDLRKVSKEKCWQFCQAVQGGWFERDHAVTVVFDNGSINEHTQGTFKRIDHLPLNQD